MPPPAIEVQGLTKRFRRSPVVDDLSFQVPAGSICGLLGNNGAGKTTTIRMLMGHLHPSAGLVHTLSADPRRHPEATLRRIAYVSESMALPGGMSVEAAIRMNARFFPQWDGKLAERLLDEFELRRRGWFGALSKGQKRKAMLLLALCQRADLLIFDEPTSGLDVDSRRGFLDCLLDIALEGQRTVLISSHVLSDIERIADRIIILRNGRLLIEGELDALKSNVRRLVFPAPLAPGLLDEHFSVHVCGSSPTGGCTATVLNYCDVAFERFISALPHEQRLDIQVRGFNLEDLYLELTRRAAPVPYRMREEARA